MVILSKNKEKSKKALDRAERLFFFNGGMLKTSSALKLGIHPRILYEMEKERLIIKLARGLYRLAQLPPLSQPELVIISLKVPKAVLCLGSALAFHKLTTQVFDEIHLAIKKGSEPPRISYPRVRLFWFSPFTFSEAIETYEVDGVPVRVYSPEKTIADCFKYRHKLGISLGLEALKLSREQNPLDQTELMRCARICRVEKILQPYLEALF